MIELPIVTQLRDLAEEWFEMCDDIHKPLTDAADIITKLVDALEIAREHIGLMYETLTHVSEASECAQSRAAATETIAKVDEALQAGGQNI